MVVGAWDRSPFGGFADVMIETQDGERVLLAPTSAVAEFVSQTYTFDRIELGAVDVRYTAAGFRVTAPGLTVSASLGGPAPFDWLLRLVPPPLTRAPAWLHLINPVATMLVPGVRTAGSAGNGRREYYGVQRTRLITAVDGTFDGEDVGGLAALHPPVRFGFSSAPSTPQWVSVTTTIDLP
ncbi:hypothetical protein ACIA48_21725 [Mycobacterium sp. NPDC051804]|uniref:hypothetical protein n=1 Tax=Mycobacterium sp. NPDC051804 TaxID=3364295 RepID=UPI0037BBDBAA